MKPLIFVGIISISLFISGGSSLKQVFPQPVLRNPSFEEYCATKNTGFFFAPDPAQYLGNGLNNISLSNAVSLMKWNVSGQGLQVVYGSASDGDCSLSPFWDREAGGVNQTFSTAPNASYLVRVDIMVFAEFCGDSVPGVISIGLPTGRQIAPKFPGRLGINSWFSLIYLIQANSYQTEFSITGIEGSCGIAVDNLRVELVRKANNTVILNGGFELASGIPADPGSAGYQLQRGSQALSSWVVIGNGVTCFGPSVFLPAEGNRLIWLATQNNLTQEPGGLTKTFFTIPHVTYQISFDATCQCNSHSSSTPAQCQLEIVIGGGLGSLNFSLPAQNHTAGNPGWRQRVVEFTAMLQQTKVTFQDSTPSHRIFGAAYKECAPYLDNVVVTIPAQQALMKLKTALGSPGTLGNWDSASSDPCLSPPSTWTGVTCSGADVTGLDLSGLGLSQEIPKKLFALYPALKSLNLSYNSLNGSIPSFLASMWNLISLDLSNNKLQGFIPMTLSHPSLQVLKLEENELQGEIPSTFGIPRFKVLSLQNNNLSGPVPLQIIVSYEINDTILTVKPGNRYLCSDYYEATSLHLDRCNPNDSYHSGIFVRLVAIITAAGATYLTALSLVLGFSSRRSRKYKTAHRAQEVLEKIDLRLDTCQAFSFQELEEATQGFSEVLGRGGYGRVCKAHLKDGRVAAVKRLNHVSRQGPQEFIAEVELLSRLHHANLVSLLGYCIQDGEHILVYEFMPKGSLYDILHKPTTRQPLAWEDRMKIAGHIAFGIEYLHYFASPGLVHRDIKSSNILLDERNNAKVADFGLSKESPEVEEAQTTAVKGSFGYLDPAYVKTNKLSSKADVFSYGVILLELITGRRPVVDWELLTDWCKQFFELDVSLMLDPTLARHYVECELRMLASIARDCIIEDRELRPNMRSIVHLLTESPSPTRALSPPCSQSCKFDQVLQSNGESEGANDSSVLLPR